MTEHEYRDYIYKKVDKVKTKEQLDEIINEVVTGPHDYGTIVVGMGAAMMATMRYIDRQPTGGITGFQASCVSWELIKKLTSMKPPMRLVDYNNMLFPQYESKFQKTIDAETWAHLVIEAKKHLVENEKAPPNVIAHWKSIVKGQIPFGYKIGES